MKRNILIIGLAGILGISSGLISCSPNYETDFNVSTLVVPDRSQAAIVFSLEGGEGTIEVQTNVPLDNWQAVSNAEWCKLTKKPDGVIVSAGENSIYKQRLAEITISYGHQSYSITVAQFGLEPAILVGDEMMQDGYVKEINPELKEVIIPVATNLELDNIIVPDTCSWVHFSEQLSMSKMVRADNVDQHSLKFTLDQNTDTLVRYCTVILQSSQNYSYTSSFVIKQQKRGYIIEINDENKEFQLSAMGGIVKVPFKVNGPAQAYTYEIEESAKSWITPVSAPLTRVMREVYEEFTIKANTLEEVLTGHIIFKSTDPVSPNEFVVTIIQDKFVPVPPVCVTNITATSGEGFITLNWDIPENKDYNSIKISYHDKVRSKNQVIEITDHDAASYVVKGTYQCAGEYTFTVTTYGPTGMATENPVTVVGTSKVSPNLIPVNLTVDMLYGNASHTVPSEANLANLIDNNIETFYHTRYGSVMPAPIKPHHLQIDLSKTPIQNLRFEYDGRNSASRDGDPVRVGIWGSNTGLKNVDDGWELLGKEIFTQITTPGGHSTPDDNVYANKPYKYIRFVPESNRKADPMNASNFPTAWWNMSNIYLYNVNTEDEMWAEKELGI